MKKFVFILIIFLTIFIFTFTKNNRSITEITYVNSIGIEYNNDTNEFIMYFLILNNYTIAQSGNSPSFTNTHSYIAKGSEKSLLDAENEIRNNSNTKFDLSHIRSLIINDNFFVNNNILKLYDYIKNNPKYNHTFEIYTTKDSIDKIYQVENFSEVSGYYTILVNTQNNIPVKHVRFNDFCNDLLIKNYTQHYQRIKINEGIIADSKKKYISLDYDGISFINDEYQINSFKYQNINGLAYLTTKINRSFNIQYENNTYSFLPNNFKITYYIRNSKLHIKVKIHGTFINKINHNSTFLKNILEEQIRSDLEIMYDILQNYDIDIYNINYQSHNKYDYKNIKRVYDFNIVINA